LGIGTIGPRTEKGILKKTHFSLGVKRMFKKQRVPGAVEPPASHGEPTTL
jgi:hypothetical protein